MATVVPCKNVVRVRFDGHSEQPPGVSSKNIMDIMRDEQGQSKVEDVSPSPPKSLISSPGRSYESKHQIVSKPPRSKQLQSIMLLLGQHNQSCTADDCNSLYLIDAEWMNAWHRCVASNDMSLYPGPITNWGLIEGYGHDKTLPPDAVSALMTRAKQMRGLSFDGEELDFADELEEFQTQRRNLLGPDSDPVNGVAPAAVVTDYDYQTCRFPLKANLREDVDFYLLPGEVWQALHGWYGGGPPLPRLLQHSFQHRTTAPCRGAHELLRLPPAALMEDGTAAEAESEAPVMHELDLYAPNPEQLPCVQDADRLHRALPNAPLRRAEDGYSSAASLAGGLSTVPSMAELSLTAAPSVLSRESSVTISDTSQPDQHPHREGGGAARRAAGSARCHVCQLPATTRCSKCGSIYYCGRECQLLHWRFHKGLCAKLAKRRALEEEKQRAEAAQTADGIIAAAPASAKVQHDRGGKVGLNNLGNSCYMNSSLQCLSHIKPLTLAFLSQRALKDLNVESRDGSGGKLADQYSKLLQELWFEAARPSVSPHQLKATLGRINSEYAGLAQQDAHELIEMLLDKLHEDLNRVRKKPYTERVESDGTQDERRVAEEAWATHGRREDSLVRDLLGSLMRYQLTCGSCGRVSLSFEYHTTLQVAIPRRNTVTRRVIFVPQVQDLPRPGDGKGTVLDALLAASEPLVLEVTLDRLNSVRALREAVRQRLPPSELRASGGDLLLVESGSFPSQSGVARILRDPMALAKLHQDCVIFAYCPPASRPNHVFIFQRAYEPSMGEAESDSAGDYDREQGPDWGDLLCPGLVGVPLLVSYDRKWVCSRLRYQVLLNVLRLFRRDSPLLRRAGGCEIAELMQLSGVLELRLVDAHGESLVRPSTDAGAETAEAGDSAGGKNPFVQRIRELWASAAPTDVDQGDWMRAVAQLAARDGGSEDAQGLVERLFGTPLSGDKQLKIADFGMGRPVRDGEACATFFLALDLVGEHSGVSGINSQLLSKLFPASDENGQVAAGGQGEPTLAQCLSEHTREELMEAGNEVYCGRCKEHRQARKVVRFCRSRLPQVLVLSLKRFEYRDLSGIGGLSGGGGGLGLGLGLQGGAHREKIDTFVDFPIDGLDLAPYCQPEQGQGSEGEGGDEGGTLYDLFAVCNHYGRMGFGHYTAAARDWTPDGLSPHWYSYDDNDVSGPLSAEEIDAEVRSRNAYILFYRRRGSPITVGGAAVAR